MTTPTTTFNDIYDNIRQHRQQRTATGQPTSSRNKLQQAKVLSATTEASKTMESQFSDNFQCSTMLVFVLLIKKYEI